MRCRHFANRWAQRYPCTWIVAGRLRCTTASLASWPAARIYGLHARLCLRVAACSDAPARGTGPRRLELGFKLAHRALSATIEASSTCVLPQSRLQAL
eukprot:355642-Chlamydomonas_euryale.AAC.1